MPDLFTFNGRIGRARYFVSVVLISLAWAAWIITSVFFLEAAPKGSPEEIAGKLSLWVMSFVFCYLACVIISKRLHDFGFSGWRAVPIVLVAALAERFLDSVWPGALLILGLALVRGNDIADRHG